MPEAPSSTGHTSDTRRRAVTGVIVFGASLPIMYALAGPALMTVGLIFWVVPALVTLRLAPGLVPPLGTTLTRLDPVYVLFALLASLQNGLLAAALTRQASRRRTIIAVAVLVVVPATIALGSLAYRAWMAPPNRSAEVRRLIEDAYGEDVIDLRVRQVNDIGRETDVPFRMYYHTWGYRAEYRVGGAPVTVHLALVQNEDARENSVEDAGVPEAEGEFYRRGLFPTAAVFPAQANLTDAGLVSILTAYAEGSGQAEAADVWETFDAGGMAGPPGWREYVVARRHIEPGHGGWEAAQREQYVVALDRATNEAQYLGKLTDTE